ncbi:MAG TPA: alpha/beta hydrolase [Dehalococcoidia bacterium]|nr:alpha/beta hydrolase [Dehalococcoidia bacterium]
MAKQTYSREDARPEVKALLEMMTAARAATPRVFEPGPMRQFDLSIAAAWGIGAPDVAVEREIRIPGPAGELRALVYAPTVSQERGLPVVLHFHGGGYVIMLPESCAKLSKQIAAGANAVVVSLDYRRAPEHPFPAAVDDAVAAFRWLRENAADLGGDPARIGLFGDSAGGGLAAAAALRLLGDGDAPAAVGLYCPWLDLANATPSFRALGPDDPVIDDATMDYWRRCYAPDERQWDDPLASPLRGDVTKFPPACVVVGGLDPLYDDGVQFVEKLRAAGRDVELHEYGDMPHEFGLYPQLTPLTDAMDRMSAFFTRVLR